MAITLDGTNGITTPAVDADPGSIDVASLTVAGNAISAAGGMGFRNRIINGDMRIAQRGTAAVTTSNTFPVDRFLCGFSTDGAFSGQQDSSAPVGFVNSFKWTTTTADASLSASQFCQFRQAIEGTNVSDLAWGTANAKTVTVSFWVRSSLTGTFAGSLRNSAANRSYVFTYTISAADTWEYKTVTIAGDTSGTWLTTTGVGIYLTFDLGTGSTYQTTAGSWTAGSYWTTSSATSVIGTLNATWYITGIQLEVGSVATPFEHRSYGEELALCRRYYRKLGGAVSQPISGQGGQYLDANTIYLSYSDDLTDMRATPTASLLGTANTDYAVYNSPFSAETGFTFTLVIYGNRGGIQIQCAKTVHGLSNTPQLYFGSVTSSGFLAISSEL